MFTRAQIHLINQKRKDLFIQITDVNLADMGLFPNFEITCSNVAQRKRAGLITRRTLDRNQPLLLSAIFFLLCESFQKLFTSIDRGDGVLGRQSFLECRCQDLVLFVGQEILRVVSGMTPIMTRACPR